MDTAPKPKSIRRGKSRGRGQGEGTIYKRTDRRKRTDGSVIEVERWCAMVDLGFHGGRRVRKIIYGRTRGDVAEKLTLLLADRTRGLEPATDHGHVTVGEWLQTWLEVSAAMRFSP